MTTTPRARAGQPYVPPFPTRRVTPEQVAAMPVDFVLPDDEAETISEFSADVMAATWSFWAWSALIWTACWLGIGYFFGRHFA